ncbi:xanthine dehydrogenase family protein molybdopterin-binding subunit [Fodinisporobacter ferrooxydans]|uniref:Xanthine dehydrogenase family protein molybdopterin-binding subunit n=2 Tax=Fodinisporobacter ferrooxydans TaxID=2901836 RepID=A0ABY4CU11_9BACL|nr:xanthine dehydrogenase family protein molybdopterin-binding subunit [Alicyclobacillaceae bacterium MYW30-H2]
MSVPRKDGAEKVTGRAKYTNDFLKPGLLHAKLVTSVYAHATLVSIDTQKARNVPGVRAIVTGEDFPLLTGSPLEDRPPLAVDKVRYHGEPIAIVVADQENIAMQAASLIDVKYAPLPVVNSPRAALSANAPLLHPNLATYHVHSDVYPVANTNIANHTKIRKGNMEEGWKQCDVVIEANLSFPQSDHAAMEPRCVVAEIAPDHTISLISASQSPFIIRSLISHYFQIPIENVNVHTPFVGGAFGGKAPVQLEFLAVLASWAVGGRSVKLANEREQDFITSPVHIGLDADIQLGATKEGKFVAAAIQYRFDGGAYSDRAVIISQAAAVSCTGPYGIDRVHCDSFCVYTNHPYATSFRGFGHPELTFVIERAIDMLAAKLDIDPVELRLKNAIRPGDTSPTQTLLTCSTVGNLEKCLESIKQMMNWEQGRYEKIDDHRVRAKGICSFWKNSSTPTNASAGAVLLFHPNGSVNLVCGAVEIGQGTKTALAQIAAERLGMDVNHIHVVMDVHTDTTAEHWKTVASRSTFLVGRAVLAAAEDAIRQFKYNASFALRSEPADLEVGGNRVFRKDNPADGIDIVEIVHGYTYPNGNTVGHPVIGRGSYVVHHLTTLNKETGKGIPGPEWTVGAQGVEVELDLKNSTYKILKAVSVIDAGNVLNPKLARGQIMGGMSMGLSFAGREAFVYSEEGKILNPQLRTYKVHHYGDHPEYLVDFVETPHLEAPYGLRGIGEHGVIGMPAALANSLSRACGIDLNWLPLTPEAIWRARGGGR